MCYLSDGLALTDTILVSGSKASGSPTGVDALGLKTFGIQFDIATRCRVQIQMILDCRNFHIAVNIDYMEFSNMTYIYQERTFLLNMNI